MDDYDYLFKVLTIGKCGVGKTSIMDRIVRNEFNRERYNTIGVDFEVKKYGIDGKIVKAMYWDTAGQEKYQNLYHGYYIGSHCIFIVFDLNDPVSFNNVEYWFDSAKEHFGKLPLIFVIGSKSDLNQRVSERMIIKLSKKLGNLPIYYCSSLNGNGVNKMENDLINLLLKLSLDGDGIVHNKEKSKEQNKRCYLV